MTDSKTDMNTLPTEDISISKLFGIKSGMKVKGFKNTSDRVP